MSKKIFIIIALALFVQQSLYPMQFVKDPKTVSLAAVVAAGFALRYAPIKHIDIKTSGSLGASVAAGALVSLVQKSLSEYIYDAITNKINQYLTFIPNSKSKTNSALYAKIIGIAAIGAVLKYGIALPAYRSWGASINIKAAPTKGKTAAAITPQNLLFLIASDFMALYNTAKGMWPNITKLPGDPQSFWAAARTAAQ